MQIIEVISIPVTDQQKSKEFYLSIGFHLINESDMGNGTKWVQLALGGGSSTIALVTWYPQMSPGSVQGIVVKSDNIETEVAELKAKGVNVQDIDNTPWGKFASFSDPDGNGFTLRQE